MLQLHRLLLADSQQHQQHASAAHLVHLISLQQQQRCSTPKLALSQQQQHVRAASSKGRGGRKTPASVKGYDRLLNQWAHMTARPGSGSSSSSKDAAKRPHAFSSRAPNQHGSKNSRRKSTSSSSSSWYWDADMAQAAAAAQLDPDELHNLVFGRSSSTDSSSSSSKGSTRRQQRKAARRRAKSLRKQAASMGWGYDGFGFAWGAARSANEGRWGGSAYASSADSDTDSYSDTEEDDDEFLGGAYSYTSPGRFTRQGRSSTQQRQWQDWYYQAQPDWQWWTEDQEREWFRQAWQQPRGGQGQQQQRSSQERSAGGQSSSHHRAWWERFQEQRQHSHQRQHQYQQQQQQQQWRQWDYSSSDGSAGTGGGSYWQQKQAPPSHPPAILQHLSALGLPSNTQLHKQHLKVAFHKAAMQFHPDKHPGVAAKAAAEVKFKAVKAAYEVLVQHATG